jgi:NAD(P)-dependent dehydrogenase (short-subunit alcohol dehydrogenase family)
VNDVPAPPGVAVITGGTGGIGLACASRLGRSYRIVLGDVDEHELGAVAAALRVEGVEVYPVICDVRDTDSVNALARFAENVGDVEAIVHAAGVSPAGMGDAEQILDINLAGTERVLAAFEPVEAGTRVGVAIASIGGHRAFAREYDSLLLGSLDEGGVARIVAHANAAGASMRAYALSKRGVIVAVERHCAAWGRHGGRLVSISPGLVADTKMGRAAAQFASVSNYGSASALGRAAAAQEVSELVEFLVSPAAGYLTGCDIQLDGGLKAKIDQGPPAARAAWHAGT